MRYRDIVIKNIKSIKKFIKHILIGITILIVMALIYYYPIWWVRRYNLPVKLIVSIVWFALNILIYKMLIELWCEWNKRRQK